MSPQCRSVAVPIHVGSAFALRVTVGQRGLRTIASWWKALFGVKVALVAVCRLDMLRIKAGSQRRACQEEPAPT